MTPATMQYTGELVIDACWCGITHAIPQDLYDKQRRDFHAGRKQTSIYCPLGHTYIRAGEGEAEKLKRNLELARNRAARQTARADQAEASARAHKGHATRLRRRAKAGVCPCCNRSFKALREHMQRMHPDFAAETHS